MGKSRSWLLCQVAEPFEWEVPSCLFQREFTCLKLTIEALSSMMPLSGMALEESLWSSETVWAWPILMGSSWTAFATLTGPGAILIMSVPLAPVWLLLPSSRWLNESDFFLGGDSRRLSHGASDCLESGIFTTDFMLCLNFWPVTSFVPISDSVGSTTSIVLRVHRDGVLRRKRNWPGFRMLVAFPAFCFCPGQIALMSSQIAQLEQLFPPAQLCLPSLALHDEHILCVTCSTGWWIAENHKEFHFYKAIIVSNIDLPFFCPRLWMGSQVLMQLGGDLNW